MINKKGNVIAIIVVFMALVLVLFMGVIMVFGSAIVNWTWDIVSPELTTLGVVGKTNLTEVADYTIKPVNIIIQQFTWATGVLYVMMLIGLLGIIFVSRASPSRWLIGFFIVGIILLIVISMFVSNIYQDFYDGTDELALILKEHTVLSHMILYAPLYFTIFLFFAGIILFSGIQQEEFY